jgi:hypothetical protein
MYRFLGKRPAKLMQDIGHNCEYLVKLFPQALKKMDTGDSVGNRYPEF